MATKLGPLKERIVVGLWSGSEADIEVFMRHLKEKVGHPLTDLSHRRPGKLERTQLQTFDIQLQSFCQGSLSDSFEAVEALSSCKRHDLD